MALADVVMLNTGIVRQVCQQIQYILWNVGNLWTQIVHVS